MIAYELQEENSISIQIGKDVSREDMTSIDFTIEALTEGNPNTTIRLRLQDGISIHWIEHLERLCENIPNSYSIERVPTLERHL
tara:strand:+ start:5203 stop:5454 length:252 start_codon:yes stop_codon:yes gene_type:complete